MRTKTTLFLLIALTMLFSLVNPLGTTVAAAATSRLYKKKITRLWTENGNNIPTCWATPGYDREKAIISNAVTRTWQSVTNVDFTWREGCPASGSELYVKIQIGRHTSVATSPRGLPLFDHSTDGQTRPGGMDSLSAPTTAPLEVQVTPGVTFWVEDNGESLQPRMEYAAVHEFGHLLGFEHEQDRPEAEARACGAVAPAYEGVTIGPYDPESIMNYCNADGNRNGFLSEGDIANVRTLYGFPPMVVMGTAGSPLNVLARTQTHMDAFWVGANGDMSSTTWILNSGSWRQQFGIAFPASVRADSPVVAIARTPTHLDVFWVGANGDVSSTWWDAKLDNGKWHPQFGIALPGSVRQGSPLTVVARTPEHLDVFWEGANGDVSSTWWDGNFNNGHWNPQFGIALPGSVRAGSPLTVVARTPTHLDIFWAGANGDVSSSWWDGNFNNGKWNPQFGIAFPGSVREGSPLTVVARRREHLDVFWEGANGDVSSTFWDGNFNNGHWNPQFGIALPGSVRAGSPLTVLARTPEHLDVFWEGANGDVSSTWWEGNFNSGKWNPQFGIAFPGSVGPGSPLTVLTRTPQRLDVFWEGANGDVSNTWRDGNTNNGQWNPKVNVALPGSLK